MSPKATHLLDLCLGLPISLALTATRRLRALFPQRPVSAPPKKILLIKMVEQGATVLAYRAIVRATEMVGRENVYFWVFAKNRPVLDLLDVIPPENVLTVRDSGAVRLSLDLLRTLLKIRRLGIDATVDMEFFARTPVVLAFLTGAARRVGLHRFTAEGPFRGDLLTHRIQHNPYLHVAAAYHVLVDALLQKPGEDPVAKVPVPTLDFAPPRFEPGLDELQRVREIVRTEVGQALPGRLLLLNPNASDLLPLRRWATDRFIELGRRLLTDDPTATIAITGAPDEQPAGEAIAKAIEDAAGGRAPGGPRRAVCLAGRTTLREVVVLYTLSDLLVTNDSGPGHFSSLTDVPSIVLFGPETPALFGPLGPSSHALSADLACSPCVSALNHRRSPCTNNVCMQELTVDRVYRLARDLLDRRLRKRPRLELTVLTPRLRVPADATLASAE